METLYIFLIYLSWHTKKRKAAIVLSGGSILLHPITGSLEENSNLILDNNFIVHKILSFINLYLLHHLVIILLTFLWVQFIIKILTLPLPFFYCKVSPSWKFNIRCNVTKFG